MNEEQYRALCEACDRVLLAHDSTIERVAIPWLHVIREHPVFLVNYADIFKSAKGFKRIIHKLWRICWNLAVWLRQIERSWVSGEKPWSESKELSNKIDVLFVSHLLNGSQAGRRDDFYFGDLPDKLVSNGYTAVITLINHSGQDAQKLAYQWNANAVPRVILCSSLRFFQEMALHRRLKIESFRLRKLSKQNDQGLFRSILERASDEALSGGSHTALRIASQIGMLVEKLQPDAIVVTHEGHAWERVAFATARRSKPGVRCIGYQHAAVFRLQHAIRRNLSPQFNPDHILTAGIVSKTQLDSVPGLKGIPISVLGSNRYYKRKDLTCQPFAQEDFHRNVNNLSCLVLPEGIASECHILFEFSLNCALSCPEIQFIWRLHPIMTYALLTAQNRILRKLPDNITISQTTLEEDIARCCWALYRGTTAIVPAVLAGLRPIYLQLPDEIPIDPLYELDDWRLSVKTIAEFIRVIKDDKDNLPKNNKSGYTYAEDYCMNFFKPLDPDILKAAIVPKGKGCEESCT